MRYQLHKYNKSIINDVIQWKQQLIVAMTLIKLMNCLIIKIKQCNFSEAQSEIKISDNIRNNKIRNIEFNTNE